MFRALSVRNYRIYATGALISNTGTWMQNTAQAWLVLQLTGSGVLLGVTLALQLLPTMVLSPVAGALADRVSKRRLLAIMQIGMALPSALLGLLAVLGAVRTWHVLAIAVLFGTARAIEAPARQSFVPEMVDRVDLSNAVALNSASFNSGRLIGPAVAGLLIAALGGGVTATGWVIGLNAVSYLGALLALKVMDPGELHPAPRSGGGRGSVREGMRYVRSRPDLVLLFTVVFFLGCFGMNFQITSSLMTTEVFGLGAREFGLLGTILAIGSLTGSLLAALRTRPRLRFVVLAALTFATVQIASGLMPTYLSYAAVLPLVGVSVLTAATTANALIQMTTSPVMRGRVAAFYLMVFLGSTPIGAPIIGAIAEHLGPRVALCVSGGMVALGTLAAVAWYLHRMHLSLRFARPRRLYLGPSHPRATAAVDETAA